MSRREHLRAVERAQSRLETERLRWHADTAVLRAHLQRHRVAWLIGGGLGSGFLGGILPWRAGSHLLRMATSLSTLLMTSPIGTMLIESARRNARSNGKTADIQAAPESTDS